ncbi:DUF1642 domain-containing protein [Listeria monocytogenes]|nr:DUF1642 domain-containing protein [Listeria monocytogenes]EGI1284611.1 DUF1642 domain-containing protein [Listeria monocytogenes]EHQ3678780.1 DUF1642 domain-containing protein [Listeria monocytogenes]MHC62919.1 DUF1642 domain-containing protein [Listeria monocytogenes]HDI3362282.1 DUF1642 domain-containing protein [Listeria monocytogenes]
MKFKEGDKVQFIREGSLIDGVVMGSDNINHEIIYKVGLNGLKNSVVYFNEGALISPAPLPIIPQFIADAIEVFREKEYDLAVAIDYEACTDECVRDMSLDSKVRGWLWETSNQELFARAWLDGYEVEKELLYYIKVIDSYFGYINLNLKTGAYTTSTNEEPVGFKTKFTEKEIKALDERYWQFRVPVEEVEETK